MKKYLVSISSLLLILIFISCASNNYSIAPEYRGQKISGSILIIPTIDRINVAQSEEMFEQNELASFEKEYFKYLSENLKDKIKSSSTFHSVNYVELKTKPVYETKSFDTKNNESIHIDVPVKPLEISNSIGDFVLFLQGISLAINTENKDSSSPAKHFNVTATEGRDIKVSNAKDFDHFFVFELKYLIYDNNVGKPVSCGFFSYKQKYENQKNVEQIFKSAAEKIAAEVIKDSPFEK
jgi:hypothetical protein